jgi:cobalamin biosynthesis protein CobT
LQIKKNDQCLLETWSLSSAEKPAAAMRGKSFKINDLRRLASIGRGAPRSKDRGPRAKELRKKGKAGDAGPTIRGPRITLHRSGHAAARPRCPCLTLDDRPVDDQQVDDRQVDDQQVDDQQVDDRQVDDQQVDDRQVDDQQVDDQQVDDQQVDDRPVDDQQVNDRQVDDRPAHKKTPPMGGVRGQAMGQLNNTSKAVLLYPSFRGPS